MRLLILFIAFFVVFSCQQQIKSEDREKTNELLEQRKKRPVAVKNGKIFEQEGTKFLYGGEQKNQHFDISNCSLIDSQFHYGIGREKFPALLEPKFVTIADVDSMYSDSSRFLLVQSESEVKVYSIEDLTHHEIVNDYINGEPIMAVYCILADLGAIYQRTYRDKPFTFALSGYTYYDDNIWDGRDAFVFWDRETESLWWPITEEAVSGKMKGTQLKLLDEQHWHETNWKVIKSEYPDARVLASGQDFERPKSWPKYE